METDFFVHVREHSVKYCSNLLKAWNLKRIACLKRGLICIFKEVLCCFSNVAEL